MRVMDELMRFDCRGGSENMREYECKEKRVDLKIAEDRTAEIESGGKGRVEDRRLKEKGKR